MAPVRHSMTALNASLERVLAGMPAGTCRLVLSERVDDVLTGLSHLGPSQLQSRRFVVVAWDRLPTHSTLLEEVIDRLADAALLLWPEWYSAKSTPSTEVQPVETGPSQARTGEVKGAVLPRWLALAENASQAGLRPRFKREFTAETEVRQLGLALGNQSTQLVLAVRDSSQDSAALAGLARTAEWLLHEAKMPILVIVPTSLGSASELDSISFNTVNHQGFSFTSQAGLPNSGSTARNTCDSTSSPVKSRPLQPVGLDEHYFEQVPGEEEPSPHPSNFPQSETTQTHRRSRLFIHPLIGRPHPDSRGEQLLWARLAADEALSGMFECNVWVATDCDSTYLVDFVWRDGRVVVEIDGYYWHSCQSQFAFDRHRDYELLVSGFSVMRIPHDELLSDLSLAVEKIRRLVRVSRTCRVETRV